MLCTQVTPPLCLPSQQQAVQHTRHSSTQLSGYQSCCWQCVGICSGEAGDAAQVAGLLFLRTLLAGICFLAQALFAWARWHAPFRAPTQQPPTSTNIAFIRCSNAPKVSPRSTAYTGKQAWFYVRFIPLTVKKQQLWLHQVKCIQQTRDSVSRDWVGSDESSLRQKLHQDVAKVTSFHWPCTKGFDSFLYTFC